jgi:cation:H+ antiporter
MLYASIAILLGFAGLIWSADRFVAGSAGIAKNLGMAPVLIGLTIVAFGTSAPEILVSISAALEDAGELAVGNALGSNLANIGLVLGVTAIIAPLPIAAAQMKRELPILIAITLAASYCLYDARLTLLDSILLLTALFAIMGYLVNSKSHQPDAEHQADVEHLPDVAMAKAWLLFFIGLGLLIISSQVLVWGAKEVAQAFGVSELVIGLTIVAVGTSLPELAATIASALKGHHDIAIGNVLGSNLFNLLAVMAVPAFFEPLSLAPEVFARDYLSMTAITLLLAIMLYGHRIWARLARSQQQSYRHNHLGRLGGALLLLSYGAYYYWLFISQS